MTLEKRLSIDRKNKQTKKGAVMTIQERIHLAKDVALGTHRTIPY